MYAAELSAPCKETKKPNYKVFKSEDWRKAEIEAKAASRKWIQAGKPRNEDDQHFKAKKETNIKLRSAIKLSTIKRTQKKTTK